MPRGGSVSATAICKGGIVERDLKCLWHPFRQAKTAPRPIHLDKAEGAYLYGNEGKKIFDGISSWWVNLHGHAHPHIAKRLMETMGDLDQVVFADFTHMPAVELAETLLRLLKMKTGRVFYTDNGSTAVETALKMAIQYWVNLNPTFAPCKILCYENGYHGDTFGAMSVAGTKTFNTPFLPYLFEVHVIPAPTKGKEEVSLASLKQFLDKGGAACFIFEPYLQASGGMILHSLEVLDEQLRICREAGVLTIADEVMTGFGRTGKLFACDNLKNKPDFYCLSKGLTNGLLPLGAVVCSEQIYQGFWSDRPNHALLHGHTFCGNALACAAALGSLELLVRDHCEEQRRMIEKKHKAFKTSCEGNPWLVRCEVAGTVMILEYRGENQGSYFASKAQWLSQYFMKHQIFVRPLGNTLYLMPPYCTTAEELDRIYACIEMSWRNYGR